jgi:hypothetical protein
MHTYSGPRELFPILSVAPAPVYGRPKCHHRMPPGRLPSWCAEDAVRPYDQMSPDNQAKRQDALNGWQTEGEREKTSNPGWSADGQPIVNDFTSTQDDADEFMTFHTINEWCLLLDHHVCYTVLIELTTARLSDKSEADIRVMVFTLVLSHLLRLLRARVLSAWVVGRLTSNLCLSVFA